jgi:lipoprotein-anchoring transpeptidase ErfK/SrfK
MLSRTFDLLPGGPSSASQARIAAGPRRYWRLLFGAAVSPFVATAIVALAAAAQSLPGQGPDRDARRILVSLQENRLWLVEGGDTLMAVSVAVGRRETFRYRGKVYDWRTPRGERRILSKRRDPVWTVPQWHYYERAAREDLELVEMVRDMHYPLADGSRLEVRGSDVVRILGQQYWKVPQGREIIIDGVLYVPPLGTTQRRVPGALGTRALDLGDGYLIHGTSPYNESSVGTAASHGCVRMNNDDVERLFGLVVTGTPVTIY